MNYIYRGKTTKEVYLASLLYDAIDDEDFSVIKFFLSNKGASPNIVLPKLGISPFHLAIGIAPEKTAKDITALLLQYDADPNVRSDDGITPLHIAAAYGRKEILKLLLDCGGDPEIRDVNYQKPIYYAVEHGHNDCVDLLKEYTQDNSELFRSRKKEKDCKLTLEKILVNNDTSVGEYEVVEEYKTEKIDDQNLEVLEQLPKTDSTEYVINWCNKNLPTPPAKESSLESTEPSRNNSDYSDFHESDDPSTRIPQNIENITFRKIYRKKRKISKDNSVSSKSDRSPKSESCHLNEPKSRMNELETTFFSSTSVAFSRESGIHTLPNSIRSTFDGNSPKEEVDGNGCAKSPVKNESAKSLVENKLICTDCNQEMRENGDQTLANSTQDAANEQLLEVPDVIVKSPETSSDYLTCSSLGCSNDLERNVLAASDLNNSIFTLDLTKSINGKDKSSSSDTSFISISEIYKYVDEEEGIVLFERRLLRTPTSDYNGSIKSSMSSKLSSLPETFDYDTDTLRKELTKHGYNPGPITVTTKKIYLRKLRQLKVQPPQPITSNKVWKKVYSVELERAIIDPNWMKDTIYKSLEDAVSKEFEAPNPTRKWREGHTKSSFTYLLLDPRVTNNLPCRYELIEPKEIWQTFLSSIFYVGKGKRSRPYSHLYEAVTLWNAGKRTSENNKLDRILRIWGDNCGVVCLHVFQNVIPVEAYTREAAMISALKLENVCNAKMGDFYGIASTWPQRQKKKLGVFLLYKAMMIFLNEGERQLCPADIQ